MIVQQQNTGLEKDIKKDSYIIYIFFNQTIQPMSNHIKHFSYSDSSSGYAKEKNITF